MSLYKHLLAFDLTSYGAALSLINQYADGDAVKDFEISPCGSNAQLILLAKDLMSLEVIKNSSLSLLKSQILDVQVVSDIHPQLLPSYLSQIQVQLKKNLIVVEGGRLPWALLLMDRLLKKNLLPVDFRIVRTDKKNVILTVTADSISEISSLEINEFKMTIIEKVEPGLKSLFEL